MLLRRAGRGQQLFPRPRDQTLRYSSVRAKPGKGEGMIAAGSLAPEFTLDRLGGGRLSLRQILEHGPALLAFYKISCPVCQLTLPFLNRIAAGPLPVIAISQDDENGTAKFQEKFQITLPTLLDREGEHIRPVTPSASPMCRRYSWSKRTAASRWPWMVFPGAIWKRSAPAPASIRSAAKTSRSGNPADARRIELRSEAFRGRFHQARSLHSRRRGATA